MNIQWLFTIRKLGRAFVLMIALGTLILPCFAQTLDNFGFSTITTAKVAHVPFRVIITARSSTGATVRTFTGTPTLTATSGGVPIRIEALSPMKFTSGQWVGFLVFREAGADVTFQVTSSGKSGTSPVLTVSEPNFRTLDLPVLSMASDLTRGVLYASVGPTNAASGTIHVIDPATGAITGSHAIAGGVERIELNRDASKLYIVSEDQLKIRRLSLPDFTEEAVITLGEWEPGAANYARDIAPHPTRPDVVAVVKGRRNLSPWFTGISVFEDTEEKSTPSALMHAATVVQWGAAANRLYGHDNTSSPNNFIQFDVTETNLTAVAERRNLMSTFGGDLDVMNGRLYSSSGRIIDPETFELHGEVLNGHSEAVMLPLPERKRIVYFTPTTVGQMIIYDSDTLQILGTEPFPMPVGEYSGAAFWGDNGVAFHDGQRLYLAQHALIPSSPAPADIQVIANPTQPVRLPGVDTELAFVVKNAGPNEARDLLVSVFASTNFVRTAASVVGKDASVTAVERGLNIEFASLGSGEQAEVRFSARTSAPGWEPISIIATSSSVDPIGANNSAMIVMKTVAAPSDPKSQALVRLAASDVVVDAKRGTLIVAASASTAPFANTVTTFNPATGEFTQPLVVGSRPSQLAISDDGELLYVGFDGLPEVRRYRLPSMEYDLTIPLGADGWTGPRFATDIAVRPGHPTEMAVARRTIGDDEDTVGYFHNATDLQADRSQPNSVRFANADRLLAYEDSWGVFRFDVTDQSITFKDILRNITAGSPPDFVHHNGKLYFNAGSVYDAETATRLGQFNFFGPYGPGPVFDPANSRALFVSRGVSQQLIWAFNADTYSLIDTNLLDGNIGTLNAFVRWGGNGLALAGASGVIIAKTDLLPSAPEELRVASVALNAGGGLAIHFANLGPGQYVIQECAELGGEWTQVGEPFTEGTGEIPIALGAAKKFYRLVKLP